MLIESKGDGHVIKEDFPNAIKSFEEAQQEYRKAFNFAKKYEDKPSKEKASKKELDCEGKKQEIMMLHYDKIL